MVWRNLDRFPLLHPQHDIVQIIFLIIHFPIHPVWPLVWVWPISILSSYHHWLSSSEFNLSVHHMITSIFVESEHVATTASAHQVHFEPAIRTFEAIKHEMTCIAQLTIRHRTSCEILACNGLALFPEWKGVSRVAHCDPAWIIQGYIYTQVSPVDFVFRFSAGPSLTEFGVHYGWLSGIKKDTHYNFYYQPFSTPTYSPITFLVCSSAGFVASDADWMPNCRNSDHRA